MSRLQKKCLIAVAGTHLLAVVLLFCTGFFKSTPKEDAVPVLDLLPVTAIDKALNSGVKAAELPPPTPVIQPPPQPQPQPDPPKPIEPPVKQVEPPVKQVEPDQPPEKTQPEAELPVPKPKPPKPRQAQVDPNELKLVVRKKTPEPDKKQQEEKTARDQAAREKSARDEAKRQHDAAVKAIQNIANSIKRNTSAAMSVDVPGDSSASYANYGAFVVSAYHRAWVSPQNMANDSAVVSFSVTVARDGNVISSHITSSSGDANVDNAVQRMLDRVTFIHALPDDSTDRERTFNIDFNATRTSIQ
jgi:TonB family protein